jgi:hypothetical protein
VGKRNIVLSIATLVVLIAIGLCVGCCSTTDSVSKTTAASYTPAYSSSSSSTSSVTTSATPEVLVLSIGESAETSDMVVTVISAERTRSYKYYSSILEKYLTKSADPGKDYVLVDAEVKYTGSRSTYATSSDFSLSDSEGYRYDPDLYSGDDNFPLLQELYPNQKVKGKFVFTVPSSATGIRLYYDFGTLFTGTDLVYWQL